MTIAYFDSPGKLHTTTPAKDLVRDSSGNIMLAASGVAKGAVIGIADDASINDYYIGYADNLQLANNVIDWLMTRPPNANFTYSPSDPHVGETITFDASFSQDPDGTIVSYLWDFGDSATGNGVIVTHQYNAAKTYTVTLTVVDNNGLNSTASMNLTTIRTTIDVQAKVGSIHFGGETAEFYVLVSSMGMPLDTDISATLYYNGTAFEDLSASAEHVSLGLYRISYAIPADAPAGTYALVVEAEQLSLKGIALESFLLSPTLTGLNAMLISIETTTGTIRTSLGTIEVKLDTINATLASIDGRTATINTTLGLIHTDLDTINALLIGLNNTSATIQTDVGTIMVSTADIQLKVIAINGTTATIQTTLGTINGTITDVEQDIANIVVPRIGSVQTDISNLAKTQESWTIPQYLTTIMAVIAAVSSVISIILLRRKKTPGPEPKQQNT